MSSNETLKVEIIQKAWEDEAFKNQLIANPKAALKQAFSITLPDDIKVKAVEETSTEFVLAFLRILQKYWLLRMVIESNW